VSLQILGEEVEVVKVDSRSDRVTVKFGSYKWMLNITSCQLLNAPDFSAIETSSMFAVQNAKTGIAAGVITKSAEAKSICG